MDLLFCGIPEPTAGNIKQAPSGFYILGALYKAFICVCVIQYTQLCIHKVASTPYLVQLWQR